MAAIQISEAEFAEMEEKQVLEAQVKATVNAARRKAQATLDQWKDRHMGPKWANATKFYDSYKRLNSKVKLLEAQKMELETPADVDRVCPILRALEDWHALNPVTNDVPTLTEFGILATEINEGNPLLIAKLYESGLLKDATAEEIVGTLGAFIVDREASEKSEHPRAIPIISERVKDVLLTLDTWGQEGRDIDRKNGIESPEQYWDITTLWTMIGTQWYLGEEAGALSKKYEIYEGNLMRGLLKLTNLVNEWVSLATYKTDVDMLDKLKDVQVTMLRDIAQPESLYLRM
jgi:superfamily II RNA helicase